MRTASVRKLGVGIVAAGLVLTGCGTTADGGSASGGDSGPISGLRVMVPNSPGSGYDTTARAWAQVLDDEKIADSVEVFNLEGAGGTVGLQRLVNEKGNDKLLMQMGLGVVGAQFSNKSEATLDQTTPIAKLIEESEAIVVPANSPFKSMSDLVTAWKTDPGNTPVGGASNPGGPDHLTPMLLAQEVGVKPSDVNYVAYDGGGELLAGILGGDVKFAATGIGEVSESAAAGQVRILAVTTDKPVDGVDAPTLQDEGINLTFSNWRGIVAPPGLDEAQTQSFVDAVTKMHDSDAWQKVLEDQGWTDAFSTGDEFKSFVADESKRVQNVMSRRCCSPRAGSPAAPSGRRPYRWWWVACWSWSASSSPSTCSAAGEVNPRAARTSNSVAAPTGARSASSRWPSWPTRCSSSRSAGRCPARSCSGAPPSRSAAGTTSATP
jgi:putative tricarboxylic transport membrane protein